MEVRAFIAYQGSPPSSNRHYSSCNGFHSFWYLLEGRVRVAPVNAESFVLKAGEWVFVPAFLDKRQDFSDETKLISVGFDALWENGSPWTSLDIAIRGQASPEHPLIMAAKSVMDAIRSREHVPLAEIRLNLEQALAFQAGLLRLVAELTPTIREQGGKTEMQQQDVDPRLSSLLRDLRAHPNIHPLPFDEWQRQIGLGRVQLDRLARVGYGLPLRKLRDRFLLAATRRRLLSRRESVKEIAGAFGFSDSSHLCRWFRKQSGQSPEEFRSHGSG
jgi:AraC-like DNA-binding protein